MLQYTFIASMSHSENILDLLKVFSRSARDCRMQSSFHSRANPNIQFNNTGILVLSINFAIGVYVHLRFIFTSFLGMPF